MGSLGAFFPKQIREQLAAENLIIGAVLRIAVIDTNPPKIKYLVIVGIDVDQVSFATIFLNTDLNLNVINTPELQNLQIWLEKTKCGEILEGDCYADCSKISEREKKNIVDLIEKDPAMHRGIIPDDYLNEIKNLLSKSETILPIHKKKYNFSQQVI